MSNSHQSSSTGCVLTTEDISAALVYWLKVNGCHEIVMHGGVKATLTELRSRYWLVRGRQLVKNILHQCVVCCRFQAKSYCPSQAPPRPSFRVNEAQPLSYTGVDFAGPLYVRDTIASTSRKVWILFVHMLCDPCCTLGCSP